MQMGDHIPGCPVHEASGSLPFVGFEGLEKVMELFDFRHEVKAFLQHLNSSPCLRLRIAFLRPRLQKPNCLAR